MLCIGWLTLFYVFAYHYQFLKFFKINYSQPDNNDLPTNSVENNMPTHVPFNWTCEGTSVIVRIMGENFNQYNNKKTKEMKFIKKIMIDCQRWV